jgi:hypothetical protein
VRVFPLVFRELAAALGRAHAIDPAKQSAFESRIKNLQRLGFLPETNTGRGKKASYGVEEAVLLAMAIELLQLGVTPERVIGVINPRKAAVVEELRSAARSGNFLGSSPKLMYFDPRALADLQDEQAAKRPGLGLDIVRFGAGRDLGTFFGRHRKGSPRLAVIDLQKVVAGFLDGLQHTLQTGGEGLAEDLRDWGFQ